MSSGASAEISGYEKRAQFYDIEYSETRDHKFLISRVGLPSATIMVLPGGTGTTALALHRAHPDCVIYSVDIEPEMVAAAHDRFGRDGNASPHSVLGDMTKLSFDTTFDHIFVAREAFQMLPDDDNALACLRSMKAQLALGGEIVLDVANFDAPAQASDLIYYDASRVDGTRYLDCRNPYRDTHLLRHVTQFIEPDGDRRFRFDYEIEATNAQPHEQFDANLSLRKYDLPKLDWLIEKAGMSLEHVYGNYEKAPFTKASPRICCILR